MFALVLVAGGTGASRETKQTLAVLEAALASEKSETHNQLVDVRKAELFSAIPMINRWLLQLELAPRLRSYIYQAELKWTVGTLLLMSAASGFITGYLIYLKSHVFLLSAALGLFAGLIPTFYVFHKRGKRFSKFEQELPEAVDLMVNALRAGHSLISALGLVSKEAPDPIGKEFRICFEEQNYGLDLRVALENLATRVPIQDLRIIITAIMIQKESGGNLAEVLDKTSHLIRERFRLKRQVQVHTAQGRMTGWVLSFLPLILGIGLYIINPENMSMLWKRELGIKLLYASGIMTTLGALIIRKIVDVDV